MMQKLTTTMSGFDWAGKVPVLVNLLLVLALAQVLASLSWRLLPLPEPLVPPPEVVQGSAPAAAPVPGDLGGQIAAWHLFGRVQKEKRVAPAAPPPRAEAAPDTSLRLSLRGVFVSDQADDAWVIVADHRGKEETYRPGDTLPGGATLLEVYADRVILQHNGRRETLRLPASNMDNTSTKSRAGARSRPRGPAQSVTTLSSEASQVLSEYRQKLLTDPQSVMSAVRAEPYRKGGRLMGYRVFPGADRKLMQKIGLRPGDVVTRINGVALDSPLKGLEVMQKISDASEITVDVLRDGVNQTFVVPIN